MRNDDILILKGSEINSLLAGQELRMIDIVQMAYEAHGRGESSLPHSTFLRFHRLTRLSRRQVRTCRHQVGGLFPWKPGTWDGPGISPRRVEFGADGKA